MRHKIVISGINDGELEDAIVRAVVRGHLAIHPAYNEIGWCLTHVPTGLRIGEFLSCCQARRAYRSIAHLDWSFTQIKGPHFQELKAVVLPAIRRAALADTPPARDGG